MLEGPGAAPEDVAQELGVTLKRQAELKKIMAEVRSRHKATAAKSSKKTAAVRK